MKSKLQLFAVAFSLVLGSHAALAQSAPAPAPAAAPKSATLPPLTPEEKVKLMKAREQAMTENPDLKTEGDALKQQMQSMKGGDATPEDKADFMQKMQAHEQKMKAAILKDDPTMQPLLDKAEALMKQRFQERARQDGGGA